MLPSHAGLPTTLPPVHRFLASWFGSGLLLRQVRGSDEGSGTVGSVVALALVWLIGPDRWAWQLAAAIGITALSIWSAARFTDEGDPGWIVIDEAAGTFVATIGLGIVPALIAFVVFRVADATKILPGISAAERLPGSWGITADDTLAGLYALAVGWIVQSVT